MIDNLKFQTILSILGCLVAIATFIDKVIDIVNKLEARIEKKKEKTQIPETPPSNQED